MALDKNLLSDEEVVIGKTSLLSDDEVDLSVEKKNEPISGGSGVSQPDLKRQSVPSTVSGTKAKAEIDKRMSQPITLGDESRQMGIAKSDMGMPSREEQLVKADVVTNQNEYRTIEKNLSGKVKTQREKEKELQNKLKISQYIQKLIGDSGNVVEGEGAPMVEEDIDLDIFVPIKFEIDELQPEKISENANPELRDRVILKNSKEARQKTYDFENVIKPNISLVKKRSDAKALLQKTNEDINKLSQDLNTINEEVEGDITKARSKNKLAMVELGIPDSFALGVTESIKAIDLSKAMASGDDDKVGAILEDAYIQNRLYGDRKTSQISQMLGGQAVPLGVSFATAIVSGGNPLLTAGVTSSVYGGMGAGMSATQAYIELRNQGKSQAEALDVAKNMAIVGGVGGVAEGVIGTTLQAGKIASKVLGLNKGFAKTLVTAMAEAGVDGTAAMGVQASDNLFAIANGIDRKVSDGVLEQGAMEVAFGAGYQVLFKGASKLTPKTYKKLVNEYAKFSTVIHQQVIDKAVKDGVISASDAKPILDDIVASSNAQQKLQGVEIPEKAVDDVIDLQKQLDVLEEQKKTASPAALPAIEGKIEQLSSEIQIKAAIPLTAKEKTELNKLQTAKDSNTEYDKERLKFLEDRQKSSLKAIKEADEVAQRLELAEMKKLQESKREIELSVEPKVKQESIIKQENLEENLGKTVSVNNKTGVLAKEGENRYVVEGDGFVFEINNESVVVDKTPAPKEKKKATLVDNKVDIDGTSYDLVSVNKDNNDKVVSLTLKKDNGQSITIRDEDLALDIAIAQKEQSLGIKPTETAPVQEETKVVEAQQPTQETGVEPAVSNSKGVEIVEDTEYTEFIDKGKVTPERLNDIANKVKNREQLSPRETEIFSDKTGEINKIIATQEQPKAEAETLKPNDKAVIQGVDVNIPDAKTQEILKEERNEKPYFDKEVEKLDNSTLSEEEVNALLDRDDVAILTGTNPDNNAVDDATNVRLNQEAEKWLKEKGYKYHPTAGKYNQAENSFIVEGITVADAIEFAKVFKQESVAHSEGLVYKNGEINPRVRESDRSNVDTSNPDENFVSAVKTKDGKVIGFQFGIDFDTTNKYEKPKEAPVVEPSAEAEKTNFKPNKVLTGANKLISKVADGYKKANKFFSKTPRLVTKVSEVDGKRIADAFNQMKHEPNNPEVKKGFEQLITEIKKQADALIKEGFKFELVTEGKAYNSDSKKMLNDVKNNKRILIEASEGAFGTKRTFDQDNIGLQDSGYTDVNGRKLTNVELIRAVHDLFGHSEYGNGFGAIGEENAWRVHMSMFTPLAQKALTATTRGQNSWVNFGNHMRNADGSIKKKGDAGYLEPNKRPFAEQKIGFLPDWAMENAYGDRVKINGKEIKPTNKYVVDGKEVYEIDDAQAFFDAISSAKESRGDDGIQVALKTKEEYQKVLDEGGVLLVSKDGNVGVMLEANGNVGSGFAHSDVPKGENSLKPLLITAIKLGGRFTDAYETYLPKYYAKFGFKPLYRMKFNPEFADKGWEKTTLKSEPDVVFMYFDGNRETLEADYNKFPAYDETQGEYVTDYDKATEGARAKSIEIEGQASLTPPPDTKATKTTKPTKPTKLETAKAKLAEIKKKRDELAKKKGNLGAVVDPFEDAKNQAKADRELFDAYVEVAKEYIAEVGGDIQAWAQEIGEEVNENIKLAWDEASGKKAKVEEKSIFETYDETKGASKKDKLLSEYAKENPEKAQRVREIIDNFEDMKTMLQTKIDNGEIKNLKIEC